MQGPHQVRYRWVVVALACCVNLTIQILWISYAPVNHLAQAYYGVTDTAISAFSMVFMAAFLPFSLPASWLIDARGTRVAVGLGSVLAGLGGVARGLAGDSWGAAFAATVVIAAAQPLLLNAWSATAAAWFDRHQRATAVGIITVGNLVGTAIGLTLPPSLAEVMSISAMQLWFGAAMLAAGMAYVVFARSSPSVAPDEDARVPRSLVTDGLKHALGLRPYLLILAVAFVGLGVFNGVTTWVEPMLAPRGFSSADAGTFGAVMLGSGLVGAIVISTLSDRSGLRVPFLAGCASFAAPALAGLALVTSYGATMVFGALLGFFLTALIPVAIEYASEIAVPTPEGTSNGLVQLVGQASVAVVALMGVTRAGDGSFTPSLFALTATLVLLGIVTRRMPEPRHARRQAVEDPAVVPDSGLDSRALRRRRGRTRS